MKRWVTSCSLCRVVLIFALVFSIFYCLFVKPLAMRARIESFLIVLFILAKSESIDKNMHSGPRFLFYIVENIRQHYIFDKASFYFGLCIFVTAFCCISIITHRTYINRYSKNTSKHKNNSSEPSDLKFQAAIFGCVFFSTTGLITASLLTTSTTNVALSDKSAKYPLFTMSFISLSICR